MPITRTYECDDCDQQFQRIHYDRNEPAPECPYCEAAKTRNIPGMFGKPGFGTTSIKSKAIDYAQQSLATDYGLTDLRTGTREGESVVVPPPPIQAAERGQMVEELKAAYGPAAPAMAEHLIPQVEGFWQKNQTPTLPPEVAAAKAAVEAAAASSGGAARAAGEDPIALLHKAKPRVNMEVIARADREGKEIAKPARRAQ